MFMVYQIFALQDLGFRHKCYCGVHYKVLDTSKTAIRAGYLQVNRPGFQFMKTFEKYVNIEAKSIQNTPLSCS